MHPLSDVLQRPNRIFTRITLEEAHKRQLEQRNPRQETFGRTRTEQFARLVEHNQRAERALVSQAADGQPSRLAERLQLKQAREFVRLVAELHELPARRYRAALARRQMIERRIEHGRRDARARDELALAQHPPSLVEANERQYGDTIDFDQRIAEREQRGVLTGGDGQRMSERGERARRHCKAGGRTLRARGSARRQREM